MRIMDKSERQKPGTI